MVLPILLYGSEVWGYGNLDVLERVHLKFCKILLNVKKSTPSFIVYGELGRFPLYVYAKTRIVSYWSSIIEGKESKYAAIIYRLLYIFSLNGTKTKWINSAESIFNECGMNNIWLYQNFCNRTWLTKCVKQKLLDQFLQKWFSYSNSSSKGISYNLFTNFNFQLQNYLSSELSNNDKAVLSKFRSSNTKLPIETGRWYNIPHENRLCNICKDDIGDEYHYILCCKAFTNYRNIYIPEFFRTKPNTIKFFTLFNTKDIHLLKSLCRFIKIINERIGPPG